MFDLSHFIKILIMHKENLELMAQILIGDSAHLVFPASVLIKTEQ